MTVSFFQVTLKCIFTWLGVPQSDFQHKLREHLVNSLHFPRNVEFFVSECDQFLNDKQNLIKALHPTEVTPFFTSLLT